MKSARHFLLMVATLLCSFAVHAESIADVTELSNTALYVVTQPNRVTNDVPSPSSWTVDEEGAMLTRSVTINQEDQRQQFAFISNDGGETYYLYHPATQKFVNRDASLGDLPMEAVYFAAGSTEGTFVVYFDAMHVINTNDQNGLIINDWGPFSGWGVADAGNSCAIIPVGEFNPAGALEKFEAAAEEKKKIIEFKPGANGWIEGADWYDESQRIVGFTSPLYQFSDKVETLRITINRAKGNSKFFCLSELAFYDADGQKIELTADAIVSNADHNALNPQPDGEGIPALLDGETSTFFHSAWKNMPSEDHYLEITLPNGGYDAFSFSMLSRAETSNAADGDQSHTFPAEMVITTSVPLASQAPIVPDELATLIAQVRELLAANENNHAAEPTVGQYPTAAYEALAAAVEVEDITLVALQEAVATFEAAKCFPVFTIDGAYEYVEGMSIYQIEQQLRWKQTDLTDKSMLWAIDIAETTVEVADQLVAKNLLTGDTFYGAPFIKVAETSEEIADDGLFLLYLAGRGNPVYAHESGIIITQNELSASSASAWKFTYVGTSYELSALPDEPEMPAGVINTLSAADPTKCYTIATMGRGAWAVDAENTRFSYVAVGDIDATADEQQFAILTVNEEDYYLYSVSAKKFVKHDGSLDRFTGDAIEFADASTKGKGRVQVRFRDYERSYINVNPEQGLIINYWGTIDEGNAVLIAEAGEFNAEEALSILADPEAAMLEALLAEAQEIVDANAENHDEDPVLGQYSTAGYEAFVAALEMEDITLASFREAFAAFEASKCLPVFTIDGVYNYAAGMSIFEATDGRMLWKATNESDKTMLWSFDMTETTVGVTDRVVVRNLSTGNLFWNASFMQVTETYEVTDEGTIEGTPDDGLFLLYTEGSGNPVHADEATQSIVRWNNLSANSASAWKFTYVGTTYELSALPDKPAAPAGVVNDLASADPTKCYTISTNERGAWAVDAEGTYFSTTTVEGYEVDATDARQQFAILSANGEDYYLYSVGAQKFVKRDRTLTAGRADAIEFVDGSDIGAGRVLVRFRDIDDANINIGGDKQMVIDRWNTIDEGNAVLIFEAAEFNAEEALAMLADSDAAELANLVRQAETLIADNAENHALEPTLGQYGTEAYEALVAAMSAEEVTLSSLQEVVAAFEASKCLPVFAIDGIAFGMSLYESELYGLRWQAFDRDDHTMLWVFDMAEASVGVTDRVVVRNLGTGNRFKDAFFIKVTETEEADTEDGRFLIHPEGVGFPLCAQGNGLVNPVQNWSADSPSAWKFTYIGTTYDIDEQPGEPDAPGDGEEVDPSAVYYMAPLFVEGRTSSVVKIPVKMENSGPIVGFQFDMFLPEGVSVVTTTEDDETLYNITLNKDRAKSSHTIDAEPQENGALKIISLSMENVPFEGNDGVILEVEVAIGDMEEGYYDVILRNIRMTHDNGVEEKCPDYASRIYVKGVLMGDVNGDGAHTISDVVMTINAVLKRPQAKFDASAADMNGDGMITVGDAVSVLRLVLGGGEAQAPSRSVTREIVAAPVLEAGEPASIGGGRMALPVALNNSEAYSAFQLDVALPEGVELAEATLTGRAKGSHHVVWNTLADGTVRIVAYAMNNAAFEGNEGTLFNLVLENSEAQTSRDEILLADALFVTTQGVERRANDVNVPMYAETTGVDDVYTMPIRVCGTEGAVVVACATQSAISIYAITGQLVKYTVVEAGEHIIALSAGVYVVNGSKVIVK